MRYLTPTLLAGALAFSANAAAKKPAWRLPLGQPAPVFKLRALDGALVRLDELAYPGKEKRWAKKRPVLLEFFRTDCAPCLSAMPQLVRTYEEHHAAGLDVVLVALLEQKEGRAKLERYLGKKKLPFTVVVDETEHFTKKYLGQEVVLPATFLIDRNGTLIAARYGAQGSLAEHFGPAIARVLAR